MTRDVLKPLLMAAALFIASAGHAFPKDGVVYTVNYPLQYFAEAIAGDDLDVVFPAPPDVDPADWTPDVDTLLDYQAADLILLNGAGYAEWTKGVYLARSRLLDTSAGFKDRLIAEESDEVPHVHGPTGAEVQGAAVAFTTWLDLSITRAQAKAVRDAMEARWPHLAAGFAKRFSALDADLAALDLALSEATKPLIGLPLLASHPVYQYLGRRYGLDLLALHWEPDLTPGDAAWREMAAVLSTHPAKIMLWEDAPTPETRARLATLGVEVIVFRTLANRPESGDFTSTFRENIENILRE